MCLISCITMILEYKITLKPWDAQYLIVCIWQGFGLREQSVLIRVIRIFKKRMRMLNKMVVPVVHRCPCCLKKGMRMLGVVGI